MNFKFYPLRAMLFTLLLFGFKAQVQAQDILLTKRVENVTAASDGSTADQNDELVYFIEITNLTATNYVASRLYDNIPAGVSYIANSTRMNNIAFPDVSGRMPFSASGNYVRSNGAGIGVLVPGAMCLIEFRVRVTANGGSIFNNATLEATQNGVATIQATNTVITNLTPVSACNVIYQVSPQDDDDNGSSSYIRTVNVGTGATAGQGGATPIYSGPSGTQRWANTTTNISHAGNNHFLNGCAAIAYDYAAQRIYFVNNTAGANLGYIDLSGATKIAYVWNNRSLDDNVNVNRMGMGSDGYCYALTSNGSNLIRFRINTATNMPVIEPLGPLVNAATNTSVNDVLNAPNSGGGDIFADGSGKLYLIANNSKMFKINPDPNSRVATYMGTVNPFPGTSQSLAISASGDVYINGAYHDVWRLTLGNMAATKINSSTNGVFVSGDYTSCGFPVLASSIIADKSYRNKNGSTVVNGGDTVIYTIKVTNVGNINAAGVYMYDYIPPSTIYVPGTTQLNGIAIADVGGVMPYAVNGGRLVNTLGETSGIVKPGDANSAIVTFMVVTEPNKTVCNQSRITLLDADGNVMFVNSSDPTNVGQTPTCFYSDGVLPLTNLKFRGTMKENKSVLNWSMNGDENVAYYQVEFSDNGSVYYTAGKVGGKGLNNTVNTYEFTDAEHTLAPVRYYRLKVYTKDGGYSYSGVVTLNSELTVDARPNPFDRDLNVTVNLRTSERVRIRLIDLLGKEVYSTTEQLNTGTHSIVVRIPSFLTKGMYILDVRAGTEQVYQRKLIKK
jgi:uncharacterized repeat protein (TIGR01451 family)